MDGEFELIAPAIVVTTAAGIMEQAGVDRMMVMRLTTGEDVLALDMSGIALVGTGDTDMLVNSGRLSDFLIDAGQDAFMAGWEARERVASGPSAAGYPEDPHEAWSLYTPPEYLDKQQSKLGDHHDQDHQA